MDTTSGKYCPVCKLRNEPDAIVCSHCGNLLDNIPVEQHRTTERMEEAKLFTELEKNPFDIPLVPPVGLGIYLETGVLVTVMDESEFILGRNVEETGELIVDLIPFGAFQMGVSRRHAMIRQVKDSYEIIDLNSTNGTWVDKKQIPPNRPFPLHSGALIQLGRMRLLAIFNKAGNEKANANNGA